MMSTDLYKRQIDSLQDHEDPATKRQEQEKAAKKGNKPGRKPLETEPKNKRTAQNRAAQRAFRERKEQKMKDLEDRIHTLESENKTVNTESEFLRLQVQMLTRELAKHRGTADLSDLNLPQLSSTPSSEISSQFSPNSSDSSTLRSLGEIVTGESVSEKQPQFSFEFPWSRKGSVPSDAKSTSKSPGAKFSFGSAQQVPVLTSDVSTTCSSESSPFDLYNNDDQSELPLFNKVKQGAKPVATETFDFDEHFDEGVSEFCTDLNSACGTRDKPIPKARSAPTSTIQEAATQPSKVMDDPLSFLDEQSMEFNFDTFDPSVAFAQDTHYTDLFDPPVSEELDPLSGLVSEESAYDPFNMFKETSRVVERRQSKPTVLPASVKPPMPASEHHADSEDVVVPADRQYMKCTEIWDRITAHPKYADIDIDGLCSELRSKAKCSDKGVVVDFDDVNKVIQQNIANNKMSSLS